MKSKIPVLCVQRQSVNGSMPSYVTVATNGNIAPARQVSHRQITGWLLITASLLALSVLGVISVTRMRTEAHCQSVFVGKHAQR